MPKRPYSEETLRELFARVGQEALSWDDVLAYLRGAARYEEYLTPAQRFAVAADLEALRARGEAFTVDYRIAWQAITHLPAGGEAPYWEREPAVLWGEMEHYVSGLHYPATRDDAIRQARHWEATERVLATLRRIQPGPYVNESELLEAVGDVVWERPFIPPATPRRAPGAPPPGSQDPCTPT